MSALFVKIPIIISNQMEDAIVLIVQLGHLNRIHRLKHVRIVTQIAKPAQQEE
jgi:hypothetical protein